MESWHLWIILAVFLFIVEVFTPSFIAACIGIGCVAGGIAAYAGLGTAGQLLFFSIGSLVGFFGVRPFMLRYGYKFGDDVKTNVDALVGKQGRVLVAIDNARNEGRVMVEGDDWKAESDSGEVISIGSRIEVVKVNSTILTVKPILTS